MSIADLCIRMLPVLCDALSLQPQGSEHSGGERQLHSPVLCVYTPGAPSPVKCSSESTSHVQLFFFLSKYLTPM